MNEKKVKIESPGEKQLSVDLNHVIDQICSSEAVKNDRRFREKLLGLKELQKWKIMIKSLTEERKIL
jgi:hypothetical protein